MTPLLRTLFLLPAVCCGFLYSHWHLNQNKIAALQQESAALSALRAQNQKTHAHLDELEALRQDNAELLRLRHELDSLLAGAERKRLMASRGLEEQMAQLKAENLQLRQEIEQLEQASNTVSARQAVDVGELTQIGEAFFSYAKMNGNKLPEQFAQLKPYLPADVFATLETNRFELLSGSVMANIADPANTPLIRGKAKNSQNQRPYLFADGHLEIKEE